jgi:hypothetical protein
MCDEDSVNNLLNNSERGGLDPTEPENNQEKDY